MRSPKKVDKYLGVKAGKKIEPFQGVRPSGALPPPAGVANSFEDESMLIHSLTPFKVFEKIRLDVIRVLGIQGSIAGKYTQLELKLVDFIERILRKGTCPSILTKEKDLVEAMLCLKKYFESDTVAISPIDKPSSFINVPIFPALYKYAIDAESCGQRIRELRQQRGKVNLMARRKEFDQQIRQLKERKEHSLIYYQKIIFTEAECLRSTETQRRITLDDKSVSLDELLHFLKKGGRLEQARPQPIAAKRPELRQPEIYSPSEDEQDDSLGTFGGSDDLDEVLDWHKIKSREEKPGDEPYNR